MPEAGLRWMALTWICVLSPRIQPWVDSGCTVKTSWFFSTFHSWCFPIKSNLRCSGAESRSTVLAQPLRGPLPGPFLLLPHAPALASRWPPLHAAWAATPAYKSNLSLETSDPNQMAVQCQHRVSSAPTMLDPSPARPGALKLL